MATARKLCVVCWHLPGTRVHETKKDREREREFAQQAEIAYRRLVKDWQPRPRKDGAGATPGRAS